MSSGRRGALFVPLLLALLFATLAPPIHAQNPNQPFFTLAVTMSPAQTIKERFGTSHVYLNVTLNAQQANQLSNSFTVVVSVNRTQPLSPPNGWAVSPLSAADSTFTLEPGQTKSIVVDVSLTQERPDADKVDLAFKVDSRPQPSNNPQVDPLTRTLLQTMSQEDHKTATTQVRRDLAPAEALTSFVFTYKWFLIVAALAIIGLLVLLVRRRAESGLAVDTEAPVQEVVPGRGASFPLAITNLSAERETVVLGTSDVPAGWSAILPVERLELRGNESTTIWLTLKSPTNAQPGERIQVAFLATNAEGVASEARLEAMVVRKYGDAPSEDETPDARTRTATA